MKNVLRSIISYEEAFRRPQRLDPNTENPRKSRKKNVSEEEEELETPGYIAPDYQSGNVEAGFPRTPNPVSPSATFLRLDFRDHGLG